MAKMNKLPVVSNSTTSNASPMKHEKAESAAYEAKERKWKAEEALSTIERAEAHKRDKALMREVKSLAKDKIKCLDKIK